MVGHVSCVRKKRLLAVQPEGKRPLGRPRCRREDYIKMNVKELGQEGLRWIGLAEGRNKWSAAMNMARIIRFHEMWGISFPADEVFSFSSRTVIHGVSQSVSHSFILASMSN